MMKEILPIINDWTKSSTRFAIATVIKTWGSSPRPVGSTMIVSEHSDMAGSVSGGCVENSVVKSAIGVIKTGETQRQHYGVSDKDAWAVGLSCGGQISVLIEPFMALDPRPEELAVWNTLNDCLAHNQSCVLITRLVDGNGGHTLILPDGQMIGHTVSENLKEAALQAYNQRQHECFDESENQYFLQVFARRSQMLIIGAAHITADLVDFAKTFNFETIVIDPRGAFARKSHFETKPDIIIEKYPSEVIPDYTLDAYTYAVILSHDPKIDDNALHLLLKSDVAYIGALGSKKTHAKRVARLSEAGFTEDEINRIKAPIGVNIHARKPREIALSIMAEIVSVQNN